MCNYLDRLLVQPGLPASGEGGCHCRWIASDVMNSLAEPLLNDLGVGASIVIVGGGVLGAYRAFARLYNRTIVSGSGGRPLSTR